MRIFITGGSGWIGSALVPDLLSAGHAVVGLARSDISASKLERAGAEVVRGELEGLDALPAAGRRPDGVIHLAYNHAFTDLAAAAEADARVIEALGGALEGSGKPLVIASGTPALPGRVATEDDEFDATGSLAARGANAKAAIAILHAEFRSSVVRLPRSVHGEGDLHGFIPRLIAQAREKGVSGYVGDGSSRWPAVHVLDAARLFRLAVEEAPPGSVLHAVGDEGIPTREIAACIGRHLNLPTALVPAEVYWLPRRGARTRPAGVERPDPRAVRLAAAPAAAHRGPRPGPLFRLAGAEGTGSRRRQETLGQPAALCPVTRANRELSTPAVHSGGDQPGRLGSGDGQGSPSSMVSYSGDRLDWSANSDWGLLKTLRAWHDWDVRLDPDDLLRGNDACRPANLCWASGSCSARWSRQPF